MPPETPQFDQTLASEAILLADSWITFDKTHSKPKNNNTISTSFSTSSPPSTSIEKWSTSQNTSFLDSITTQCNRRKKPLQIETITAMNGAYGMAESRKNLIDSVIFRLKLVIQAYFLSR